MGTQLMHNFERNSTMYCFAFLLWNLILYIFTRFWFKVLDLYFPSVIATIKFERGTFAPLNTESYWHSLSVFVSFFFSRSRFFCVRVCVNSSIPPVFPWQFILNLFWQHTFLHLQKICSYSSKYCATYISFRFPSSSLNTSLFTWLSLVHL